MAKFKYIEVVRDSGNLVIHRMGVTGKSDRAIEKVEGGVNINLNHSQSPPTL